MIGVRGRVIVVMVKSGGKRIKGLLGCRHFIFMVFVVGNRVRVVE
jgi:hypothetical protein